MPVNRCVCLDVAFQQILDHIAEGGDFLSAHQKTSFGSRCGQCIPYAMRAVQTGRGSLPVMWCDDFKRCGIPPGSIEQLEAKISAGDRVTEDAAANEKTPPG